MPKNWPFRRKAKRELPFPYNQDLSEVLTHVGLGTRTTQASRARLANDAVTAAYLCAGMRLLNRHLGPGAGPGARKERRLLSFLSQRNVAEAMKKNPLPFHQKGSVSTGSPAGHSCRNSSALRCLQITPLESSIDPPARSPFSRTSGAAPSSRARAAATRPAIPAPATTSRIR